jgi:hypothetical protein
MFRASSITSDNNEEKEDNKTICESLGCKNKPIEKLMVKVGKFGFIEIDLCKKCKIFFDNLKNNIEPVDKSFRGSSQQVVSSKGEE